MMYRGIYSSIIFLSILFFCTSSHARGLANPLYNIEVPETEVVGQLHGDPINADLRLYMAGNQFVAMDLLVDEFKKQNPDIKNIFYVTIPPGKELKWILSGGIEIHGENSLEPTGFQLRVMPDVYTTVNKGHMDQLNAAGLIKNYQVYAHNRLVLMTKADDPLANTTLDPATFYSLMADPNQHISEPDILTQGIERHIWQMYTDATKLMFPEDATIQAMNGKMFDPAQLGTDPVDSLRRKVYHDKEKAGQTLLTSIHHLETPANIRSGNVRFGPVWITEVKYQQNRLNKTDLAAIDIGGEGSDGKFLDRREKVNYLAAKVKAKGDRLRDNHEAAIKWIEFLTSEDAQAIFDNVGFIRATPDEIMTPFVYPTVEDDEHDEHDEHDD